MKILNGESVCEVCQGSFKAGQKVMDCGRRLIMGDEQEYNHHISARWPKMEMPALDLRDIWAIMHEDCALSTVGLERLKQAVGAITDKERNELFKYLKYTWRCTIL